MKKKDLKTGMIVETRKGTTALVVKDNCYGEDALIFTENNWTDLNAFNDDLLWYFDQSLDIIKVYQPDLPTGFLSRQNKFNDGLNLIWERKPEKIYVDISDNTTPFYLKDHIKLGSEIVVVDGSYMIDAETGKDVSGIDFIKDRNINGEEYELLTVVEINSPKQTGYEHNEEVLCYHNNCVIEGADKKRYYCSKINIRVYSETK